MRSLEEAPYFDFFDPETVARSEGRYAELRPVTAVVRTPVGAAVIRHETVKELLGDRRLISSIPHIIRMQGVNDGRLYDMLAASVISTDGEDHTRLRRLVSRSFTPRAAGKHRDAMAELVNELVDTFAADGHCEFVSQFADHYPVQVICEVLGVPRQDHDLFARWGNALTHALSFDLGAHLSDVEAASNALSDYVEGLVADRVASPRDDLVTSLVQASDGSDRLSATELFSMIGGLLFAGYDTTRNQLGLALMLFADHPEQWSMLAERPALVPSAVDEVMRLGAAVPGVPRVTLEDIEVDGWLIPANTLVFLSAYSANRDDKVYAAAADFDITADRDAHLSFGGGPHYCLGASLARAEMEEALVILSRRMTNISLDTEPEMRTGTGIVGPLRLDVRFDAA